MKVSLMKISYHEREMSSIINWIMILVAIIAAREAMSKRIAGHHQKEDNIILKKQVEEELVTKQLKET